MERNRLGELSRLLLEFTLNAARRQIESSLEDTELKVFFIFSLTLPLLPSCAIVSQANDKIAIDVATTHKSEHEQRIEPKINGGLNDEFMKRLARDA